MEQEYTHCVSSTLLTSLNGALPYIGGSKRNPVPRDFGYSMVSLIAAIEALTYGFFWAPLKLASSCIGDQHYEYCGELLESSKAILLTFAFGDLGTARDKDGCDLEQVPMVGDQPVDRVEKKGGEPKNAQARPSSRPLPAA